MKYGFTIEAKRATLSCFDQVHGKHLIQIKNPGHAEQLRKEKPPADGAYTFHPDVELSVFTADCLPILFYTSNPDGPIGVVHSGWRGALKGIAKEMLTVFGENKPKVIFGPCILQCCFEVKEDFVEALKKDGYEISAYVAKRDGKMFFDLPRFVHETQLHGVEIDTAPMRCTHCSEPQLPSYRRVKGSDPRIRSWIRKG